MKNIIAAIVVLLTFSYTYSQNSLILNSNFEHTVWPASAWMSQTNTGAHVMCDENDPVFSAAGIYARSGSRFAYIGGGQNAKGRYEATLAQTFEVTSSGIGHLTFFYRYIRSSVDPGSYVRMKIDGNEIWSIAPHYIVDAEAGYVKVQINIGHIEAGNHTFELEAYEFPVGGDLPMQFSFDDISFQTVANASVEQSTYNPLSVILNGNMIQLITAESINQDVVIEITDLSGKIIFSNAVRFSNCITIEKPTIPQGIYIISVKTLNKSFTKKLFF